MVSELLFEPVYTKILTVMVLGIFFCFSTKSVFVKSKSREYAPRHLEL